MGMRFAHGNGHAFGNTMRDVLSGGLLLLRGGIGRRAGLVRSTLSIFWRRDRGRSCLPRVFRAQSRDAEGSGDASSLGIRRRFAPRLL